MILIINNKKCTSLEQLQNYFSMPLDSNSDIYKDLLRVGVNHELTIWLRKRGEDKIARQIEQIGHCFSVHELFEEMRSRILFGKSLIPPKADFTKCISIEDVVYTKTDTLIYGYLLVRFHERAPYVYEIKIETECGS